VNTREMREQAGASLKSAQEALDSGNLETFESIVKEAQVTMAKADEMDAANAKMKALTSDFEQSYQTVPVASQDVAKYDSADKGAKTRADYKPATYVKGLPPQAQPMWVQEQMGDNLKEEAKVGKDAFIKWMSSSSEQAFQMSATPDEKKAMEESTDNEGGYFVPEAFLGNTIHDPGVPGGALRNLCNVVRVSSKDGYVPTMGSASWAAIAEEASYSDQTPTVGQVQFALEKSGGLVKVTRELLDDSAINLPALLTQIFQEASGRFEDVGILNGDNTTNYAGILQSAAADYTMAGAAAVTVADVLGIYYTLEAQHRANASWVMPSLISNEINAIGATAAGIHAISDLNSAPADFLLGKGVTHSDASGNGLATTLATGNEIAVFGDFKQYIIFDRVGYSIRRNDSLYMESDQIGFFASRRGDGQVGLTAAFKIMKNA